MTITYGFVTSTPETSAYSQSSISVNRILVQRFEAPVSSGTFIVHGIGHAACAYVTYQPTFKLAIFTDDAANENPNTTVAGSDSGNQTTARAHPAYGNEYFEYATPITLNGGSIYWIGCLVTAYTLYFNAENNPSAGVTLIADGYGDWPTPAQWDTFNYTGVYGYNWYAIYSLPPFSRITTPILTF